MDESDEEKQIPYRSRAARFMVGATVQLEAATGVARDVSVSGIFFETDQLLKPGEDVNFTLELKSDNDAPSGRLQCLGRIVRVEPAGSGYGVAATIEKFEFIS